MIDEPHSIYLTEKHSKIHSIDRLVHDLEDRLWDLEEHLMGERHEDGNIYVRRRVNRS